jgi:hypothetical protein
MEVPMNPDLKRVKQALLAYDVSMTRRPDGSVLLLVKNGDHLVSRVIDGSYTTEEIILMVKFDMTMRSDTASINEAAKYSRDINLPTYSREPIYRTRNARLWSIREIKNT